VCGQVQQKRALAQDGMRANDAIGAQTGRVDLACVVASALLFLQAGVPNVQMARRAVLATAL
jgi:hypothetical protein